MHEVSVRGRVVGTAQDIVVSAEDSGVATVTLNRPSQAQCRVAGDVATAGARSSRSSGGREDVRVVILTGAGGHFCAGADISEFPTRSRRFPVGAHLRGGERGGDDRAARLPQADHRRDLGLRHGRRLRAGAGLRPPRRRRHDADGHSRGAARRRLRRARLRAALPPGRPRQRQARALHGSRLRRERVCGHGAPRHRRRRHRARREPMRWRPRSPTMRRCRWPDPRWCSRLWLPARPQARHAEISAIIEGAMNSADYREGARAFLEKRKPAFTGR